MNIHEWAKGLWEIIEKEYTKGDRFYFSITPEGLDTIYKGGLKETSDSKGQAFDDFILACNNSLKNIYGKLHLPNEAYKNDSKDKTLAICYVAQQVLAADKMKKRSYYESYFKLLDLHAYEKNDLKNPFQWPEAFEDLWETFKEELLSDFLENEDQITFKGGLGVNRYTKFPISQALLSLKDLRIIVDRQRPVLERLQSQNEFKPQNLKYTIRSAGQHLTARGKHKIRNDSLIDDICEQVAAHLNYEFDLSDDTDSRPGRDPTPGAPSLCVFHKFGDEEFEYGIEISGNDNSPQLVTDSILERYFRNDLIILASDTPGVWNYERPSTKKLYSFNSVLIIFKIRNRLPPDFNSALGLPVEDIRFEKISSSDASLFDLSNLSDEGLSISQLYNRSEVHAARELDLGGGILLDGVKKEYLRGYPPEKIYFNNTELEEDDEITINSKKYCYTDFPKDVIDEISPDIHQLEYRGRQIKFELSPDSLLEGDQSVGYPIIEDKLSYPAKDLAEYKNDPVYLFRFIKNYYPTSTPFDTASPSELEATTTSYRFSQLEIAQFLEMDSSKWVNVSAPALSEVCNQVRATEGETANLLLHLLTVRRQAPAELLKKVI